MTGARTIVAVGVTAVLVGGAMALPARASERGVPAPAAQSPKPAMDACSILTNEEVGKAVGRTVRSGRPDRIDGGTTCRYQGGMGGTINVPYLPSVSKKQLDDFRALLVEQGEKVDPIRGVGDDGFFWGAHAYVQVGDRRLVIWIGDPNMPEAKAREDVLALAKLAAGKLR